MALKKRLPGIKSIKEKPVQFMRLEVGSAGSGQWQMECIRTDGNRLRLSATGALPPLGEMLQGFWS